MPPVVQAMVRLQLLTACRPGELLGMRACDIDRSGAPDAESAGPVHLPCAALER